MEWLWLLGRVYDYEGKQKRKLKVNLIPDMARRYIDMLNDLGYCAGATEDGLYVKF